MPLWIQQLAKNSPSSGAPGPSLNSGFVDRARQTWILVSAVLRNPARDCLALTVVVVNKGQEPNQNVKGVGKQPQAYKWMLYTRLPFLSTAFWACP